MPTDSAVGEGRKPQQQRNNTGPFDDGLSVTRFVAVDTTSLELALVQSSCVEKLMKLAIPSFDVMARSTPSEDSARASARTSIFPASYS